MTSDRPVPLVVAVGAASRDLAPDEPRGWRLGGAVTYAALTLARLGLQVQAIVGVDAAAAAAPELDLLAAAGAVVERVPLPDGPVFENLETPAGRRQRCLSPSSPLGVGSVSAALDADAVLFAPIAAELDDAWLALAPTSAIVALGLQGLLRALRADTPVRPLAPSPSGLLRRADLVGLGRDDLPPGVAADAVVRHASATAMVLVTAADLGGVAIEPESSPGVRRTRRYRAVRPERVVDPTGAGDVFLAAVLAARLVPRLAVGGGGARAARELRFAAAAASLSVEGPGIAGVPDLAAVRRRLARARSRADRRASAASIRGSGRPSHA